MRAFPLIHETCFIESAKILEVYESSSISIKLQINTCSVFEAKTIDFLQLSISVTLQASWFFLAALQVARVDRRPLIEGLFVG